MFWLRLLAALTIAWIAVGAVTVIVAMLGDSIHHPRGPRHD